MRPGDALPSALLRPLLGVDRAARIGFANPPAAALLDRADGLLREEGGRLAAGTPAATARLRQAIREAAEGEVPAAPLTLPREAALALPVLVVRAVPGEACVGEPPVLALVHAMDPHLGGAGPPAALVRAWFGLTPAEVKVALRTARGEGLRAIATALCVRHSTARSHLNRVFQKCGVRRQAELAWLIAHLPG